MNKTVSWNVRGGGGSQAREIAEEAARRQRMSLDEWLDTVIEEQAADADVPPPRSSARRDTDSRLDELLDRLGEPDRAGWDGRRSDGRARRRELEDYDPEPRFRHRYARRSRYDDDDDGYDRMERRRRRGGRLDDFESIVEDALESVEHRVAKAQRRTDLALADVAEQIERLGGTGRHPVARERAATPAPASPPSPRPGIREKAEDPSSPDRAAATQMQRLEAKLNTVLAAVAGTAPPEPKIQATRQILREAVGEIEERQRALADGPLGPLAARLQHRRNAAPIDPSQTAIALAQVQREISGLSAKLDDVKREFNAPAASAHPVSIERFEKEIAALTRQLQHDGGPLAANHTAGRPSPALDQTDPALQELRARIDMQTHEVSNAIEHANGPERSRGDMQSLAGMVSALAEKLEAARQPHADAGTMQALHRQIAQVSERLDRSDAAFEAINALQHSITELFGRLDANRRAAEEAVRPKRSGDFDRPPLDDAIAMEIAELRSLQDQADRRSQSTLNAVHTTLQKVVERLARLEDGPDSQQPDTLALGPAPTFAPPPPKPASAANSKSEGGFVANLLRGRPAEAGMPGAAPTPAPSHRSSDILIEPGMAFSRGTPPEDTTGRTNFIAAARRAAQTAQEEAKSLDARQAETRPTPRARAPASKRGFDARKRVVMLSLAALFVIAGAYAVMRSTSQPASQQTVSRAANPTHESRMTPAAPTSAQPPETALLSPTALPKTDGVSLPPPISGSDSMPVGSIGGRPAPTLAAAPPLMAPSAAPSAANLRAAADAGVAGAQYELGTRYAEGRVLPHDLKLAAQWYEKAALQGLAPAQYRLGSMYEKGLGVARDLIRARTWYQKAADAGNARAMHNLAVLTAEGTDNKPDYAGATSWFRKAAEFGVRDSQYNLAILSARGLGQPVNLIQSYAWFAAAAAQGDDDAGKKRDEIASRLDAKDLAAAKAIADAFRPRPLDPAANDVAPPPGGWDAAPAAPAPSAAKTAKPKISAL